MMAHNQNMVEEMRPTENGDSESSDNLIQELECERQALAKNNKGCRHAIRLIQDEIDRLQGKQKDPPKYLEVVKDRPTKVSVKVVVPTKEHPRFNFVGKLLGPAGNSLKRLQEETMTRMAVLGRGSMRDRSKEEELRSAGDPKYIHLHDDLHVDISAIAPPAEAYARISYALVEIRKYLIPDNNDEVAQEQMREMQMMGGVVPGAVENGPQNHVRGRGAGMRGGPANRGMRGAPMMGRGLHRPPMPFPPPVPMPQQRVMGILDKARQSLEGSQPYSEAGQSSYGAYESYGNYGMGEESYATAGRGFKASPVERSRFRQTPY